jgi:AcrR family transcriptional regulator
MATESTTQATRRYRKRRRAEQERRTRVRITEATVRLHETLGPAHTPISAIAEEAGVQRATVYRHFPDEEALFEACTAHYVARHPLPDQDEWAAVADPGERLRVALTEMYARWEDTEEMMSRVIRDMPLVGIVSSTQKRIAAFFDTAPETLMRGRPERGKARDRVAAAIGHALGFPTWHSLVREQGLEPADAVELMARMVESAGR